MPSCFCFLMRSPSREGIEIVADHALGVTSQDIMACLGDDVLAASGTVYGFSPGEGGDSPPDAVLHLGLARAEGDGELFFGEPQVCGDRGIELAT